MLWSDAKLCAILDRHDLFYRSKSVLEKYDEYKMALEQNKINIEDVIRKKMKGANTLFMRNAFPYDVDGTRHYIIWSQLPLNNDQIHDISSRHAGGREFLCFVNPDELQSVKGLWHAHCILKM